MSGRPGNPWVLAARRPWVLPGLGAALMAAGCGSGTFANHDRPPSPVMVTASVDGSHVRISPTSVGAGPVTFIVANLTRRSQRLTFETAGRGPGIRSSASIGPRGTTQIQVAPKRGSYQLSVRGGSIEPATLKVGPKRPSAQHDLLQP